MRQRFPELQKRARLIALRQAAHDGIAVRMSMQGDNVHLEVDAEGPGKRTIVVAAERFRAIVGRNPTPPDRRVRVAVVVILLALLAGLAIVRAWAGLLS